MAFQHVLQAHPTALKYEHLLRKNKTIWARMTNLPKKKAERHTPNTTFDAMTSIRRLEVLVTTAAPRIVLATKQVLVGLEIIASSRLTTVAAKVGRLKKGVVLMPSPKVRREVMIPQSFEVRIQPLVGNWDRYFIALAPELPGCRSDGDTPQEALDNIYDAIGCWIEAAQEMGRPVPQPRRAAA